MLLVIECQNFNPEFPERFTWGHLDSPKLASVASSIVNWIEHDLKTLNKNLVPGLRQALREIAEQAEV